MADLFADGPDDQVSLFSQPTAAASIQKDEPPPPPQKPAAPAPAPAATPAPAPAPAQPVEPPKVETPAATEAPVEEEPRPAPKRVRLAKPEDLVKRALNQLQRDITERFDELTEIIEGLKPTDQPRGAVLPTDEIMRRIQTEIKASEDKDRTLRQKQLAIESMNYSLAEREERANLRKQVARTMEELAAEEARFADADNDYEFKMKEIERLKGELAQSETRNDQSVSRLRNMSEKEVAKMKRDFENAQRDADLKIQQWTEEGKQMKEQLLQYLKENEKLELMKPKTTEADMRSFEEQVKQKMKGVIVQIAQGVSSLIEQNLADGSEYDGGQVCGAVRAALQQVAEDVLSRADAN